MRRLDSLLLAFPRRGKGSTWGVGGGGFELPDNSRERTQLGSKESGTSASNSSSLR